MQRRELVKHIAVGSAGLGTGYYLVDRSTDSASAAVSMDGLSISDASKTTQDGTVENVTVDVSGNWEYKLPAGKSPDTWTVTLSVSDGENVDTVAETSGDAMYLNNSNSYEVSGSVTDTSVYSTEDFKAPEGKIRKVTMAFVLVFSVVSSSGDELARAQLEDTGKVEVTNEAYNAQDFGSVNGDGGLSIAS